MTAFVAAFSCERSEAKALVATRLGSHVREESDHNQADRHEEDERQEDDGARLVPLSDDAPATG